MRKQIRRPKVPTRNLTGISIRAIMESGDATTASQVMLWLRVRGYNYEASMAAIRETASQEGFNFDAAAWDQLAGN